jgi:hypothetical protein
MTDVAVAPSEDLTLTSAVTNPDGTPRDVTGYTGEFPVTDAPTSPTVLFAGTMQITDAAGGQVAFTLPGTDTASFRGEYHVLYYQTWLVDPTGARTRIDDGRLILA